MHPPGSGKGSGSDAGPYSGNNPATVSGKVWLDDGGDNSLDNGEMGFAGVQVDLINISAGDMPQKYREYPTMEEAIAALRIALFVAKY